MNLKKRAALVLGALGLAAGLAAGVAPVAHATTWDQICGTNSKCMNDWSNGSSVKLFGPGVLNDAYFPQAVNRCQSGSNLSTAGCPITGIPAGYPIYQLKDERKANACIGNDSSGGSFATEVGCNSTSYPGTGGGAGTIVVLLQDGVCSGAWNDIVNSYWTNHFGGWSAGAESVGGQGGTNGSSVYLSDSSDWCWTGSTFNA